MHQARRADQGATAGLIWTLIHVYMFFFKVTRLLSFASFQDPAGIFELVEVVGNGTYGQVYKVGWRLRAMACCVFHEKAELWFPLSFFFKVPTVT